MNATNRNRRLSVIVVTTPLKIVQCSLLMPIAR
jgi:hypothetical protein